MKIKKISPQETTYLQMLRHVVKPPEYVNVAGTLPSTRLPSVAIVGTRKPTRYGTEVTERLARELAAKGVVIVSGLALGVDSIAHRAALEVGGTTIAVLGNGLPSIYPKVHAQLAQQIITGGGALISEYSTNEPARSHYFLKRNRLVSGMSDAIIITEAAARSGTLNTASHALEQGKDVFVVPGPITSPMSLGCNQLIKQGALPLLNSDDVLDVIMPQHSNQQASLPLGTTPLETTILRLLAEGVRDGDELQQKAKSSATDLSQALTMLEINGTIRSLGGNQWTLR